MTLRALGIKTALIMLTDLLLGWAGLFSGILSALAYDREAWTTFWMWASIGGISATGSLLVSWWCWYQLRYKG